MRKFKMPTAFTVLFAIILVMTVLTWVIPAGQYDYQEDGEPIAGTYHEVESQSQPLLPSCMAPLEGSLRGHRHRCFYSHGRWISWSTWPRRAPWTPVSPILSAS